MFGEPWREHEGADILDYTKPAEIMLEDHGGRQSWLWTFHTAF